MPLTPPRFRVPRGKQRRHRRARTITVLEGKYRPHYIVWAKRVLWTVGAEAGPESALERDRFGVFIILVTKEASSDNPVPAVVAKPDLIPIA